MNKSPISLGGVLAVLAAVLALFVAFALIPLEPRYVGAILLILALSILAP